MVQYIKSEGEWMALMNEEKLVVVDFTASWCGPCQFVAPHFEQLSKDFPDVIFAKVDVDEMDKIAQMAGIRAMPTFQFYKNGEKKDEVMGADINKVKALVTSLK